MGRSTAAAGRCHKITGTHPVHSVNSGTVRLLTAGSNAARPVYARYTLEHKPKAEERAGGAAPA